MQKIETEFWQNCGGLVQGSADGIVVELLPVDDPEPLHDEVERRLAAVLDAELRPRVACRAQGLGVRVGKISKMLIRKLANFAKFCNFLAGSFSAVSKPNSAEILLPKSKEKQVEKQERYRKIERK